MSPTPGWDRMYPSDTLCTCGHPYHRHFDGYDNMAPVGCKYYSSCECERFEAHNGTTPKLVIPQGTAMDWLQQYDAWTLGSARGGREGIREYTASVTTYARHEQGWSNGAWTPELAVQWAIEDLKPVPYIEE